MRILGTKKGHRPDGSIALVTDGELMPRVKRHFMALYGARADTGAITIRFEPGLLIAETPSLPAWFIPIVEGLLAAAETFASKESVAIQRDRSDPESTLSLTE